MDVVTLGETMVLFQSLVELPLTYAPLFTRSIAGAESNFSVALCRLGKSVRYITRVGAEPFGDLVLKTLRGEGVDTQFIMRDSEAPTGLFFREYRAGEPVTYYHRKGSAASRLQTSDVHPDWFKEARLLHVTGITPALSDSAHEAVITAMKEAKTQGLLISFDPNLRRKLWSEDKARAVLSEMLTLSDIFLPGLEEASFLLGDLAEDNYGERFLEMGPKLIVLKQGTRGATAYAKGLRVTRPAHPVEKVIDPIGAGDAFAAGFIARLLDETSPLPTSETVLGEALEQANLLGALMTQFKGDWEGTPTTAELNTQLITR